MSRSTALFLDIIEGINVGAVIDADTLTDPSSEGIRIGSSEGNDIILADHDMAERHALIERTPKGEVYLTALAPGVRLGSRQIIVGERAKWRQTMPLAVGSAKISRRALPPAPASARARITAVLAAVTTAGCVVASLFYVGSGGKVQASSPFLVTVTAKAMPASDHLLGQTAALLQQQDLARYVTITIENGAVVARGRIPSTASARWTGLQTSFDELLGNQAVLVNKVVLDTQETGPSLKIGGVSMYPVPYLITTGGQRLTEGAMLSNG